MGLASFSGGRVGSAGEGLGEGVDEKIGVGLVKVMRPASDPVALCQVAPALSHIAGSGVGEGAGAGP